MSPNPRDRERRDRIRRAALTCFARHGLHATPLSEIAVEAGMSKGGVHFYYRTKHELVHDLIERELAWWTARPDVLPDADVSLGSRVFGCLVADLAQVEDSPQRVRFFHLWVGLAEGDEMAGVRLQQAIAAMRRTYETLLSAAAGVGIDDELAELGPELLVDFVLGAWTRAISNPHGRLPARAEDLARVGMRLLGLPTEEQRPRVLRRTPRHAPAV